MWKRLSIDALSVAEDTRDDHPRSSVNRAYYSAFYAVSAVLLKCGYSIKVGYGAPTHAAACKLQGVTLGAFAARDQVSAELSILYKMRCDADYHPKKPVDQHSARVALILCRSILREVKYL